MSWGTIINTILVPGVTFADAAKINEFTEAVDTLRTEALIHAAIPVLRLVIRDDNVLPHPLGHPQRFALLDARAGGLHETVLGQPLGTVSRIRENCQNALKQYVENCQKLIIQSVDFCQNPC